LDTRPGRVGGRRRGGQGAVRGADRDTAGNGGRVRQAGAGGGQVPEHVVEEVAVRVEEVRAAEGERGLLDAEGLVKEVRHRTPDGLVVEEPGRVLGLELALLDRVGDDRHQGGTDYRFPGDTQPREHTGIYVLSTYGRHTAPFLRTWRTDSGVM